MFATKQPGAALASVQSAAIDGRMRNTRTRQKQLSSLFKSLTEHADSFVDAMQKESNLTKEEANIVVSAMLLEVRQHYENIDFEKELAQEYNVRWGKSWVGRRVAARLVYIIPQSFTKAFSVFSALSAAIEAGCCCVVEVKDTQQLMFRTSTDHERSYSICRINLPPLSAESSKRLTKKLS
jgi:acyl-CoA reductase-like NAD-dependent aldehyde dehydrogenase